jgi:hypothetical protein
MSFLIYTLPKYYCDNEIKENEMGGACSICEREEKYMQSFGKTNNEGKKTLGKARSERAT